MLGLLLWVLLFHHALSSTDMDPLRQSEEQRTSLTELEAQLEAQRVSEEWRRSKDTSSAEEGSVPTEKVRETALDESFIKEREERLKAAQEADRRRVAEQAAQLKAKKLEALRQEEERRRLAAEAARVQTQEAAQSRRLEEEEQLRAEAARLLAEAEKPASDDGTVTGSEAERKAVEEARLEADRAAAERKAVEEARLEADRAAAERKVAGDFAHMTADSAALSDGTRGSTSLGGDDTIGNGRISAPSHQRSNRDNFGRVSDDIARLNAGRVEAQRKISEDARLNAERGLDGRKTVGESTLDVNPSRTLGKYNENVHVDAPEQNKAMKASTKDENEVARGTPKNSIEPERLAAQSEIILCLLSYYTFDLENREVNKDRMPRNPDIDSRVKASIEAARNRGRGLMNLNYTGNSTHNGTDVRRRQRESIDDIKKRLKADADKFRSAQGNGVDRTNNSQANSQVNDDIPRALDKQRSSNFEAREATKMSRDFEGRVKSRKGPENFSEADIVPPHKDLHGSAAATQDVRKSHRLNTEVDRKKMATHSPNAPTLTDEVKEVDAMNRQSEKEIDSSTAFGNRASKTTEVAGSAIHESLKAPRATVDENIIRSQKMTLPRNAASSPIGIQKKVDDIRRSQVSDLNSQGFDGAFRDAAESNEHLDATTGRMMPSARIVIFGIDVLGALDENVWN